MRQASVGSFITIMFQKQLPQLSNAGNVFCFACDESNPAKRMNEKS
jgi:hypothetical protein